MKKNISLLLLISMLTACGGMNYISTKPYSDSLRARCISALPQDQQAEPKARTNCAQSAASMIHLAKRLYETKAKADLAACSEQHSDKTQIDQCFQKQQEAFYTAWIEHKPREN